MCGSGYAFMLMVSRPVRVSMSEHLDLLLGVNVTNPGILQVDARAHVLLDYVISLTAFFPIKLSGTYLHHAYEYLL
jgi:hypothetical protein